MKEYNTMTPYDEIERSEIEYTVCRDFNHISRYKGLRQVIHEGDQPGRYIALEVSNPFSTDTNVTYYTVPAHLENRLDLIAYDLLGSANYAWVIAYFNGIADGFTVLEGQKLAIPNNVSQLFNAGQVLEPINVLRLNLGSE